LVSGPPDFANPVCEQQQAVVRLSTEQLHWLLDGIDIEAVRRHPARQYLSVG
jgi:hypothetical protein